MFKLILGILVGLAALGCWIFILVEMFRDAIWKGIVGLLCGLYFIYYALFQFEHEWKWPIALTALLGSGVAGGFLAS